MHSVCASGSGICRGTSVFCGISSLDLFRGIPSGGIWYRKVYGLWFHGGHDAEQNTAGDRPLVFTGQNQLLLWRTVFCSISDETVRGKSRTHLQSYEDVCGRTCFRDAVFAGTSDGD